MSFRIIDAPQGSDGWRLARIGRLTGSRASDMLATLKSGGEAASRRDYRTQLVVERLTGQPADDGFVHAAMTWGTDCEPLARDAYEAHTGLVVHQTGFLAHDTLMVGCSLDGHVGDFTGIVEIKCPKSATHYRYLRDGKVPSDYVPQITHALWLTRAAWCDFVSFDPRFPPELQLFVVRVPWDEVGLGAYEAKAIAFLAEVQAEYDALRTMSDLRGTLAATVALHA